MNLKKIAITGVIVGIVSILVLWLVWLGRKRIESQLLQQTELQSSTGVLEREVPPEIAIPANQGSELRMRLPIKTEGYQVDYDYKELKFVINVCQPIEENIGEFKLWLKREGFDRIPENKLLYILDKECKNY